MVLAACCNVDVMKGALGFALTGFLEISFIDNSELFIKFSIFFASSSLSKGSDFFLLSENGIISSSLFKSIETSQYSSGINS